MNLHFFSSQCLPLSLSHSSLFIRFSLPKTLFLTTYLNLSLWFHFLPFFFISSLSFSFYFCLYLSFVLPHSRDPFTIFPFHCLLLSSFILHSFIPNEVWANVSPDLGSLSLSSICSLLTFVVPSLLSFSYRSLFLSFLISTFLSKSLLSVLLSLSYLLHSHSFHFHILWLP